MENSLYLQTAMFIRVNLKDPSYYGNVNKQSIKEILNSTILNKCWGMSFKNINFCKDCEYRFACKDCRPLGYADRGVLTDKSYRCSYNPYTGTWI